MGYRSHSGPGGGAGGAARPTSWDDIGETLEAIERLGREAAFARSSQ